MPHVALMLSLLLCIYYVRHFDYRGSYLFPPMNYQLLLKAPTNYQLDQNRAFNHQSQPFSPLPSVKGVKTNGQRVM